VIELRDGAISLRPWRPDDAPAVYAACQDAELQRWLPGIPRPYTEDHARAFVTSGSPHSLAVILDDRMVGSLGLHLAGGDTGSIGYWSVREMRGRGIMTRAARTLCRHAFEHLDIARLELTADPDNTASLRVAAKVGFQREGVLRSHLAHPDGHRRDSVMFSLLPVELR